MVFKSVYKTESVSVVGHARWGQWVSQGPTRNSKQRKTYSVHISSFWSEILQCL